MIKGLFCLITLLIGTATVRVETGDSKESLMFVGTIEVLAPDTGVLSGDLAIYRLAKYKIERLCQGKYTRDEVVVDHLIVTGKELENLNVGDRVCVLVTKSSSVFSRFNSPGIRESSDVVKVFFVGDKVTVCDPRNCQCCTTNNR